MNDVCYCGERITRISWDQSRAITVVHKKRSEAPLEATCAAGHTTERWLTSDEVWEILQGREETAA